MTTGSRYFEGMYRHGHDPWHLAERWYEQRKYALTAASLPLARYRHALEVGCSVGELTRLLAPRCARLLAVDRVAVAVEAARERTADLPQVRVERRTVPGQWPAGRFDLVVLSEVLYYFDGPDLRAVLDRAVGALEEDGTLVTVHWNYPVPEHCGTGSDVARTLGARAELALLADHTEPDFTLQVHQRTGPDLPVPPTPAQREGLVGPGGGEHRG